MTWTVLVTMFHVFPALSVRVYERVYVQSVEVSTLPEIVTLLHVPSTLSVRFAPSSVKREP